MCRMLFAVMVTAATLVTPPAGAQDDGVDVRAPDDSDITILPQPNSGSPPETPGDPGGWQQLTLLGIIVVALVVIILLVMREVRRARAAA